MVKVASSATIARWSVPSMISSPRTRRERRRVPATKCTSLARSPRGAAQRTVTSVSLWPQLYLAVRPPALPSSRSTMRPPGPMATLPWLPVRFASLCTHSLCIVSSRIFGSSACMLSACIWRIMLPIATGSLRAASALMSAI